MGQERQLLLEIFAKVPIGQLPTHVFEKDRKPGRQEVHITVVRQVRQLLMHVKQLIPDVYVVLGQAKIHVP